jgi:hypothetical protein
MQLGDIQAHMPNAYGMITETSGQLTNNISLASNSATWTQALTANPDNVGHVLKCVYVAEQSQTAMINYLAIKSGIWRNKSSTVENRNFLRV